MPATFLSWFERLLLRVSQISLSQVPLEETRVAAREIVEAFFRGRVAQEKLREGEEQAVSLEQAGQGQAELGQAELGQIEQGRMGLEQADPLQERYDIAHFATFVLEALADVSVPHEWSGCGVRVLNAEEASGRRFEHVFVMGVIDGAYRVFEGEDFFFAEEARLSPEHVLSGERSLAKRMIGTEDNLVFDVLTRAERSLNVSFPLAERGSSLRAHPRLRRLGVPAERMTEVTASLFELASLGISRGLDTSPTDNRADDRAATARFVVTPRAVGEGSLISADLLERAAQCSLRAWATERFDPPHAASGVLGTELIEAWGRALRRRAWRQDRSGDESEESSEDSLAVLRLEERSRIAVLAPQLRAQLERQLLEKIPPPPGREVTLGYRAVLDGIAYTLDGVRLLREGEHIRAWEVFRILREGEDAYEAFVLNPARHREWWFAHAWLERGVDVRFFAWDLHTRPRRALALDTPYATRRMEEALEALARARGALSSGLLEATPGYHCRRCAFVDLCRAF